jgi:hypothetical protein
MAGSITTPPDADGGAMPPRALSVAERLELSRNLEVERRWLRNGARPSPVDGHVQGGHNASETHDHIDWDRYLCDAEDPCGRDALLKSAARRVGDNEVLAHLGKLTKRDYDSARRGSRRARYPLSRSGHRVASPTVGNTLSISPGFAVRDTSVTTRVPPGSGCRPRSERTIQSI